MLIVVDTLRADRLGCLGSERGLTPEIDALAAEGVLFESAHSHAPWSLPSLASLLSATLPPEHGAGGMLGTLHGLPREAVTLAEHFAEAGWTTAAVTNVPYLSPRFGTLQGFQHWMGSSIESRREGRSARETTRAALSWAGRQAHATAGPLFLMVHYFDPHAVYDPPESFRPRASAPDGEASAPDGEAAAPDGEAAAPDIEEGEPILGTREHTLRLRLGELELDPELVRRAEPLYDGEVAFVDSEIGVLRRGLEELGLLEDAILVLTADNGEELLDHGSFEHGHTLYEELTRVPLILWAPGRLEPEVVEADVGQVAVGPTLCELAGLATPPAFSGRSLLAELRAGEVADRPVLTQGNMWGIKRTAWRKGGWKLIVSAEPEEPPELYHLDRDPGERRNLASDHPERLAAMARELGELRLRLGARHGEGAVLDPGLREALAALGRVDPTGEVGGR